MVTYNHEPYVAGALASVLGQSTPVAEIVVVDDGSTDATLERVRAINDPRVRILEEAHRGLERLAETYGVGLAACRGELLAVLEGDDSWPRDKLQAQLRHFIDPNVVVSHGPYAVMGARGTLLRRKVDDLNVVAGSYDALPWHLRTSYVLAVTALIRRQTLLDAGGFRQLAGTPHWDYPTFLSLAQRGAFAHAGEVVGIWRKHARSGTMEIAGRDLAGTDLAMELAIETRERLSKRKDLPSESEIRRSWSEAFVRQSWQVGRVLLVKRHYADARRLARRGLGRARSWPSRGRMLALLLAAIGRVDIEPAVRLLMRRSPIEELT